MKWIYDSAWHHPFAAYLGAVVLLVGLMRSGPVHQLSQRVPFLHGYLVFFLVTIAVDATVTGAWSPIPLGTPEYTVSSVLFIVLGDFRYFLLVRRVTRKHEPFARVLAVSAAISLVVPLTTGVLTRLVPAMQNDRVLYVVYELALGVLVLSFDRTRLVPSVDESERKWIHGASSLFATLYFGWAACDLLLLAGVEVAHVLRIVPNVLYYAVFLAFVFWTAPPAWREPGRRVGT